MSAMETETAGRFRAAPKRGVAGQFGRWRLEVADGLQTRLDTRTLRAAEAIAALLNGERVRAASVADEPPRYDAFPRRGVWLVVRIERRSTATEIARCVDETLALRVASLLTRHAPALDPPARPGVLRLGMRLPQSR
jgi:hypothetical protein